MIYTASGTPVVDRAFHNGVRTVDPITDGPRPLVAFWAGDPNGANGPGGAPLVNGDRIDRWRDPITGQYLTNTGGTARPVYERSALMGGQWVARFLRTSNHHLVLPYVRAQAYWAVLIAAFTGPTATTELVLATGQSGNAGIGKAGSTNQYFISAGTVIHSGVPWVADKPRLIVARFQGASSTQRIDKVTGTAGNPGTGAMTAFKLGSAGDGGLVGANSATCEIGFAAIYDKDPYADNTGQVLTALARDYGVDY
ncbi:hypothetical protein D1871_11200 [Nakamurella silvestris]|nr:hypothetical protein D1871_11200 [Nakamurella silvestris]